MKTEAIIAILIALIVFLTCLSIHYSAMITEYEVNLKRQTEARMDLHKRLTEKRHEVNRLSVMNTSLKKEISRLKKELSEWQEYEDVKLTAYCSCEECSEQWGRQTKSGKEATEGRTVAVDTSIIPLGSEVVINGNKYIAEDVGGGVNGLHIDIYMESHEATEEFGVQTADVKVKKEK